MEDVRKIKIKLKNIWIDLIRSIYTPYTDGSNWPLWQATILTFFKSKNLLKHIDGTAIRPQPPPKFASTHILTEEEEERVEKAEDRMDKFLAREGLVKSQVIISMAEPLTLMLQKKRSAQEVWEALVEEMTPKSLKWSSPVYKGS